MLPKKNLQTDEVQVKKICDSTSVCLLLAKIISDLLLGPFKPSLFYLFASLRTQKSFIAPPFRRSLCGLSFLGFISFPKCIFFETLEAFFLIFLIQNSKDKEKSRFLRNVLHPWGELTGCKLRKGMFLAHMLCEKKIQLKAKLPCKKTKCHIYCLEE